MNPMQFTTIYSPPTTINDKRLELESKRSRKHPKTALLSRDNCDQTKAQNNDPTVQYEAFDVSNKLPKFEDDPSGNGQLTEACPKNSENEKPPFFSILCLLFLKTTHPILVTCLPQHNPFKTSTGSH